MIAFALLLAAVNLPSPDLATAGAQDKDATAISSYIQSQARRERGEEYEDARKVVTGDLDGDGSPETVVLYTIESQGGSNNYIQYLAVLSRSGNKLVPLANVAVGGKSRRSVELDGVEVGKVKLNTLTYGPNDASCCPSIKGPTIYLLTGKTLREQKPPQPRGRHN